MHSAASCATLAPVTTGRACFISQPTNIHARTRSALQQLLAPNPVRRGDACKALVLPRLTTMLAALISLTEERYATSEIRSEIVGTPVIVVTKVELLGKIL